MASPFKAIGRALFGGGGGGGGNSMPPVVNVPPQAPPTQAPTGTSSTNKPAQGQSFMSASAPVPGPAQTATKTLLGS